jgi:signal transduction histidine kinase
MPTEATVEMVMAVMPAMWATALVGVAWCVTGLAEYRRRPANLIGPLMVLLGLAWFAAQLEHSGRALPFTIGGVFTALYLAVFGHLLIAFPDGRAGSWLGRAVVVAAYVATTFLVWLSALFNDTGQPRNLMLVHADGTAANALTALSTGVGAVLAVVVFAILVRRWRGATPARRYAIAPVLAAGSIAAVLTCAGLLAETLGAGSSALHVTFIAASIAIPVAFTLGLLRNRLVRGVVAEVVVDFGWSGTLEGLRDALARALHDPSLVLMQWRPGERRFVDALGHPMELPDAEDPRVVTFVERDGRRVGALVHDASLRDDDGLVAAVASAAGLALEVGTSRARVVAAGDAERRRIERNLHDGAQQRLVSVAMALGLADERWESDPHDARRALTRARDVLGVALGELRELSQGIHPAMLTDRGLEAALHELAYAGPLPVDLTVSLEGRLPDAVEAAAYYVVAEAVANVVKHARASSVSVSVGRREGALYVTIADDGVGGADLRGGSGLQGLVDRVEALGGTLAIRSSGRGGTLIEAAVPCGS